MSKTVWFIYLIRCNSGALYTGITINVQARFLEHQSGSKKSAKFLRGKGPLKLVYQSKIGSHSKALKMERRIKSLSKKQKELIITGQQQLPELS